MVTLRTIVMENPLYILCGAMLVLAERLMVSASVIRWDLFPRRRVGKMLSNSHPALSPHLPPILKEVASRESVYMKVYSNICHGYNYSFCRIKKDRMGSSTKQIRKGTTSVD